MTRTLDAARFAVGTLTRIRVPAPAGVDRTVTGWGLALGPAVGAGLGLASGAVLLAWGDGAVDRLLSATLAVALAAWLTRGLHWDGLADFADGLGSNAGAERALAIMRRSDIGPFGVLTLVLVVAVQVLGLARLPDGPPAVAGWALALALGRLGMALACGPWSRPARADGLGAVVVGSVTAPRLGLAMVLGLGLGAAAAAGGLLPWAVAVGWAPAAAVGTSTVIALLAARRLGGLTGDVLGAMAELSTAAALLVIALDS